MNIVVADLDQILRALAPKVLADLVRRNGQFEASEDAVQEALLAASRQWPEQGLPDDPRAWLTTVAQRRFVDHVRSERARRAREADTADVEPPAESALAGDETLTLLLMCCHPALTPLSQVALTLRAVGGLTTAQIAQAFLVPEATMAQRISRAKQAIREAGSRFELPVFDDRPAHLRAVRHVLYLIFNEGHYATSGGHLLRAELSREAIRLARQLHAELPDDGETTGLLALMLLTDAHREARTGPDGALVPLAEQDRSRWDRAEIDEGISLITHSLASSVVGPYQLQAAIAAVHAEATDADTTDWPQIVALYRVLDRVAPSPIVTLNLAVAVAMVDGPQHGLDLLAPLSTDHHLGGHHRLAAVRAHLYERLGDLAAARTDYLAAARATTSLPEQRYLEARAAALRQNA